MIFDTMKRNPIVQTELFYQRRQKPHMLFHAVFYILPTALAIITLGLYSWLANDAPPGVKTLFGGVSYGFSVSVVFTHFGLMLRTLYLASSSVARDKHQEQRWEALILTGIDAPTIVIGKWWAVVQTLWSEYLILGLLRILGVVVLATSIYFARPMLPIPPLLLWSGAAILSMTFANLCFTAACGVMTSMQTRHSIVPVAFIVRTVICLFVAATPLLYLYFLDWRLDSYLAPYTFIMRYTHTILSNGISIAQSLMTNNDYSLQSITAKFWGIGFPLLVYIGITWFILRVTQWKVERSGGLRVSEVKGNLR